MGSAAQNYQKQGYEHTQASDDLSGRLSGVSAWQRDTHFAIVAAMIARALSLLNFSLTVMMGLALTACEQAGPLSDLTEGESGRVVRVIDGDALVLDTGQSVRLIGIEAPARPYKDRSGEAHHDASRRMLEDLVLGRSVVLKYAGITRDRYDRALAHVQTTDNLGPPYWVNREMISRGGARVRIYPDTAQANAPLLPIEREARDAERGLWALPDYTVPHASDLPDRFERYQLVYATLSARLSTDEQGASCAWSLGASDLTLTIKRRAAQLCQMAPGQPVLARGYVRDGAMEISHALNLDLMTR